MYRRRYSRKDFRAWPSTLLPTMFSLGHITVNALAYSASMDGWPRAAIAQMDSRQHYSLQLQPSPSRQGRRHCLWILDFILFLDVSMFFLFKLWMRYPVCSTLPRQFSYNMFFRCFFLVFFSFFSSCFCSLFFPAFFYLLFVQIVDALPRLLHSLIVTIAAASSSK